MTVQELIDRLSGVPPTWSVRATGHASLEVWDEGDIYGWVFFDERPARFVRRKAAPKQVLIDQ